jgi:hypothetical protein
MDREPKAFGPESPASYAQYEEEDPEDGPSKLEDKRKFIHAHQKFSVQEESFRRYLASRHCRIEPAKIQKFVAGNYGLSASDITSTLIASICKIYLAELIEEARLEMTKRSRVGRLTPKYLNLAHTKLTASKNSPLFTKNSHKKCFF